MTDTPQGWNVSWRSRAEALYERRSVLRRAIELGCSGSGGAGFASFLRVRLDMGRLQGSRRASLGIGRVMFWNLTGFSHCGVVSVRSHGNWVIRGSGVPPSPATNSTALRGFLRGQPLA